MHCIKAWIRLSFTVPAMLQKSPFHDKKTNWILFYPMIHPWINKIHTGWKYQAHQIDHYHWGYWNVLMRDSFGASRSVEESDSINANADVTLMAVTWNYRRDHIEQRSGIVFLTIFRDIIDLLYLGVEEIRLDRGPVVSSSDITQIIVIQHQLYSISYGMTDIILSMTENQYTSG